MIVIAFALFVVMIIAWLVAPDGQPTKKSSSFFSETAVSVLGEPAV